MARTPKKIGRWLNHLEPRTRALLNEGRRLAHLQSLIAGPLGAASAHCRAGAVRAGELTLFADSPAWAARIRYGIPAVLTALADGFDERVERVRIKVRPSAIEPVPAPRAALSAAAAQTLTDAAKGMSDSRLAEALQRLARRAGRARP